MNRGLRELVYLCKSHQGNVGRHPLDQFEGIEDHPAPTQKRIRSPKICPEEAIELDFLIAFQIGFQGAIEIDYQKAFEKGLRKSINLGSQVAS